MTEVKIFLASSRELIDERKELEIFLSRKSERWEAERDIKLKLIIWERISNSIYAEGGKQDEYNEEVKLCNVFLILCWHKAGTYTEKEFDVAYEQLLKTNKPAICTYFKEIHDQIPVEDSLINFKTKLEKIKHFETYFSDGNDLCNLFNEELEKRYPIKSVKSSIWIGIVGLVLVCVFGFYYYQNVHGKLFDLEGQRYIIGGLFLFGLSVGALLIGLMNIIQKLTKRYFISERNLAITSAIVTVIIGWFTIIPPVTIYHIQGKVLDTNQKPISQVELNIEGSELLMHSDLEGNYNFTFTNCQRDSLITIVTSHTNYEDASLTFKFDCSELSKDIILAPVHP